MATGDFDGHGTIDVVVVGSGAARLGRLHGHGDGTFEPLATWQPEAPSDVNMIPEAVASGDFNHDGLADIVVSFRDTTQRPWTWSIVSYFGQPDGGFDVGHLVTDQMGAGALAVGDLDNDGRLDFVAGWSQYYFDLYFGLSDAGFEHVQGPSFQTQAPADVTQIALSDLNSDGLLDAVFGTNLSSPDGIYVSLNLGNRAFGTGFSVNDWAYGGTEFPTSIALADLDGDGRQDLIAGNMTGVCSTAQLGLGDGGFGPAVCASNFEYGAQVAAGAVGLGGAPGIVSTNQLFSDAEVYSYSRDAGFGLAEAIALGDRSSWIVAADLNSDSALDLVVALPNRNAIAVALHQHGTGGASGGGASSGSTGASSSTSFSSSGWGSAGSNSSSTGSGEGVSSSSSGASSEGSSIGSGGTSSSSLGPSSSGTSSAQGSTSGGAGSTSGSTGSSASQCDGGFFLPPIWYGALNPNALASADLNGDGKLDLIVASQGIRVMLGDGAGSFQILSASFLAGSYPDSLAVGDFNRDGHPDLAVTNYYDNDVSILIGNGDGTLQAPVNSSVGSEPVAVATADLDGDSNADLIVVNYGDKNVSVLLGNGDGTFKPSVTYAAGSGARYLAIGDFNSDGITDVAVANESAANVSVFLGHGDGSFANAVSYAAEPYVSLGGIASGDFNGDGRLDLAVTEAGGYELTVILGNGDGTFGAPRWYQAQQQPYTVLSSDLDGDGKTDLVISTWSAYVTVLRGQGDGTFPEHVDSFLYDGWLIPLTLGDFNGDGRPDLAVGSEYSGRVGIMLNDSCTP